MDPEMSGQRQDVRGNIPDRGRSQLWLAMITIDGYWVLSPLKPTELHPLMMPLLGEVVKLYKVVSEEREILILKFLTH